MHLWRMWVALPAATFACAASASRADVTKPTSGGAPSLFLGGLGTGTLEWRSDGTFGRVALMRNRDFPLEDLPGAFMALWVSRGERTEVRVLAGRGGYGLPCLPQAHVVARYPTGVLECRDEALPVEVSVRAWSPLVPQDSVASGLPLVILTAHVRNSAASPAAVAIAMSWESTLGVGGAPGIGSFANRTGIVSEAIPPLERTTGVVFTGPPIVDAPVDDMRRHNGRGSQVVMTEYPSTSASVTTASWNALDRVPSWWDGFARTGEVVGVDRTGVEGSVHPAGCVATKVVLEAGESREYAFAVAWRQDRFYDSQGMSWVQPASRMFADAASIARYGLANRQALLTLSTEWQSRVERSSAGSENLGALSSELAEGVHAVDVRAEEDGTRSRVVTVDRGGAAVEAVRERGEVPLMLSFPLCLSEDLRRRAEGLAGGSAVGGLAPAVLAHAWFAGDRAWAGAMWPFLRPAVASVANGGEDPSLPSQDLRAMADLAALANDTELVLALRRLGAARPLDNAELLGDSAWARWLIWAGCIYSRLTETLELDTSNAAPGTSRRAAVFHPAFWGWTEWRRTATGADIMLRVDRTMGPPRGSALPITVEGLAGAPGIRVQTIQVRVARIPRASVVTLMHGVTPVPCRVQVDEGYGLTLTPTEALELRTGDRLSLTVVWAAPRGR